MVFSSFPVYLDPPNWQQQPNHHHHLPANGSENPELLPPLPVPQTAQVGIGAGSTRPGSTQAALRCPRCESTNTKFCYFNNYSLSQPRHFCKTCRRYWTRGGALRNVPVGGGCHRNKKSKRSGSKSPAAIDKEEQEQEQEQATSEIPSGCTRTTDQLIAHQLPQPSTWPLMASSSHNLTRYGLGNMTLSLPQTQVGFQMGYNLSGGAGGVDHYWLLQQFPFLTSFESSAGAASGSYPFQSESVEEGGSSRVPTQLPPVKLEDNRGSLSIPENNQYFSWTDLSGLASSSTAHLL